MDEKYKTEIEQKIVDTIADAVEAGTLKEAQLPEISNYVLSKIDQITTQDQLIGFLSHLSLKWPIFQNIAMAEEAKLQKVVETNVAKDMIRLINQGDTDQAVTLAKSISPNKINYGRR